MPALLKKYFKATGEFPIEAAAELETYGIGLPIQQCLGESGWNGDPIAGIVLELSPDNRRIDRGEFYIVGSLTKEILEVQANTLWAAADPAVTLAITLPLAHRFRFASGTLASDYLACEDFTHAFKKNGNNIALTEWAAHGVGETALRAVCHLDKLSNNRQGPRARITILLLPNSVEDLIALSGSTQSPAWPGLRVLTTSCAFFARPAVWADPICPLFLRGGSAGGAPNMPAGQEIRHHVAAIMQSAKVPTICTKLKTLTAQGRKALADIEDMEKEPTITWPAVARHESTTGTELRNSIVTCLVRQQFLLNNMYLSFLSFFLQPRTAVIFLLLSLSFS